MINVSKKTDHVKLVAEYILLPNGGNAQLDVGKNGNFVLPFIGELKDIIAENAIELDSAPGLKAALDTFIYEKEEMSDYPWIEVLWSNDVKSKNIRAKFIFNYMSKGYCLIQHYFSNSLVGMGRMNYVTNFIIEHRE
jgi:hypothetical protein